MRTRIVWALAGVGIVGILTLAFGVYWSQSTLEELDDSNLESTLSDIAASIPQPESVGLRIHVNGRDEISVQKGDEEIPLKEPQLESLRVCLKDYLEKVDDPVVVLSANDEAKGQTFVDVLNVISEVGIKNVDLAGFSSEN